MSEIYTQFSVRTWGQSDVGRVRENNEDSFLLLDITTGAAIDLTRGPLHEIGRRGLLLLVADGMGGHEAGEVASRLAVEEVAQYISVQRDRKHSVNRQAFVHALKKAILQANLRIYQASQENISHRGMGTTLTAAGIYDGAVFFAQVGDSRGYVLRGNVLARMTRDQSLVAELETAGGTEYAQEFASPFKNVLLQALGTEPQVTVPISFAELRRGDWVLLCSDGLTNMVPDEKIGDIIREATDASSACQALIAAANGNGGEDNITVVAACCDGEGYPLAEPNEVPTSQVFAAQGWRRLLPWRRKDSQR